MPEGEEKEGINPGLNLPGMSERGLFLRGLSPPSLSSGVNFRNGKPLFGTFGEGSGAHAGKRDSLTSPNLRLMYERHVPAPVGLLFLHKVDNPSRTEVLLSAQNPLRE